MKQRRPTRRKPRKQASTNEPPPVPWGWQSALEPPPRPPRASNVAMMSSSGMVAPPLPLREAAVKDKASQHEEMLLRITILERLIADLPKQPIGIGHNQPPITKEDIQEIKQAIATMKAQPVVPTALNEASAAGSTLKKIGERLGTYLDACLLEASRSVGKELGKRLVQLSYWYILLDALMKLAQSVAIWLH
jgi:hypothetical protein